MTVLVSGPGVVKAIEVIVALVNEFVPSLALASAAAGDAVGAMAQGDANKPFPYSTGRPLVKKGGKTGLARLTTTTKPSEVQETTASTSIGSALAGVSSGDVNGDLGD